jgi:hypothetical protein
MDGFASAASSGSYQVTADVVVGSTKKRGGQASSPPELALPQAGSSTADNASSPSSVSSFQPLAPAGSDVEVCLLYKVPSLPLSPLISPLIRYFADRTLDCGGGSGRVILTRTLQASPAPNLQEIVSSSGSSLTWSFDHQVTSNREIIRPMVRRGRKSGSGEDFVVTGPSPLTSPRHNATSGFYPPHLAHQRPVHIRDNHLANRKQVSRPGFSRRCAS